MESNLVHAFANETHCDLDTAFMYLQSNCWDMKAALESWHHLHVSDEEDKGPDEEKKEVKKLSRGISRATENVNLVNRARCEFAPKLAPDYLPQVNWYFMETPSFSFSLPDLSVFGEELRKFLEKDLIENSALVSLEQSGRLNWWTDIGNGQGPCQRLWPLATTGDGNCLLHAASLAIWGFHDRLLVLRKALHSFLESSQYIPALYRRWRWQQTKLNEQSGFVYSEAEWLKEWQNIVHMASVEPRKNNSSGAGDRYGGGSPNIQTGAMYSASTYESLEEIHVLVLAHVLRRPIIVIADVMLKDMNNEPFAPIPFGGIYLPFEFAGQDCHRSPLLLTYDMAHFSALVAMDISEKDKNDKPYPVIPLVDSDGMLLPVQFCVDPGPNFNWYEKYDQSVYNSFIPTEKDQIALLKKYLDVIDLSEIDNTTVSPDIDSEDEIEKRFIEVTDFSDGDNTLFGSKNRAAKQLQSVARQFGSIGKSMSKKLKKNFVSITKVTARPKKPEGYRTRMLCAEIQYKRHPYHDEMIKNYLLSAQKRFLKERKMKVANNGVSPENLRLQEQALIEGPLKCINANCDSYGTVLTSYMCDKCYETQRNEELLNINVDSRFGTGRSKFYRDSDAESYNAIKNIPVTKPNLNSDRTLYLSKSTFYYDNGEPIDSSTKENQPPKKNLPDHQAGQLKFTVTETDAKHDNNANKDGPIVRHISKFDFGNINQNVNKNVANEINSTDKGSLTETDLDQLEYECNQKPSTFLGSDILNHPNDALQILMQKKKMRDQLVKEQQNGACNLMTDSSSHNKLNSISTYQSTCDVNENKRAQSNEKNFKDIDKCLEEISSNLNVLTVGRPRKETRSNVILCAALQPCKTNNCANLASAHSDYYCTECNKERKSTGVTI